MQSGRSGRARAYEYLRHTVLTDPAFVGTFVNEQVVATAVGTSRTPVREALLRLSAEDLVQLVPHRGAFVPTISGEQVHHIMQARGMIETWAARECLATGRPPTHEMGERLDRQTSTAAEASAADFIELDREFHVALVSAAGNSVLDRMYDGLRARHVVLGIRALHTHAGRREAVLAEHRAILDALAQGDVDRVEAAILAHIRTTEQTLTGQSGS